MQSKIKRRWQKPKVKPRVIRKVPYAMLSIGITARAIQEARGSILKIIAKGGNEKVVRKGLAVFESICEVKNVLVQNCHFQT